MMTMLTFFCLVAAPVDEAQILFAGIEGLDWSETEEGHVRLEGEVHRVSDLQKIQRFHKHHPETEQNFKLSSRLRNSVEKRLKNYLSEAAPQVQIRFDGRSFLLSQNVDSEILKQAREIYPYVKVSAPVRLTAARSEIEPSIFLEIVLIEVKKTAFERLGMRIESPLGITTNFGMDWAQAGSKTLQLASDPIRGFLDLAMQKGEARIHAKQSLITQNGSAGSFQVGGELPIKIVTGLISRVEFKNYGLILKFTPRLVQNQHVHLSIESEISEIDTGGMVDGVPSISKKELRTQVYTRLDQMLALGGMVRSSQSKLRDQIPGLSALPLIGRLFESEDFKRNKSEAYIFVTPRRMDQPWLPSPEL
jgi:Flp pilus assembly secretin CpaC